MTFKIIHGQGRRKSIFPRRPFTACGFVFSLVTVCLSRTIRWYITYGDLHVRNRKFLYPSLFKASVEDHTVEISKRVLSMGTEKTGIMELPSSGRILKTHWAVLTRYWSVAPGQTHT